jgi:hypothetical protein
MKPTYEHTAMIWSDVIDQRPGDDGWRIVGVTRGPTYDGGGYGTAVVVYLERETTKVIV